MAVTAVVAVFVVKKEKLSCEADTSTTLSSTTTEEVGSGGLSYVNVKAYRFNFSLSHARLRPDRRVEGGYILTSDESVALLNDCGKKTRLKTVWNEKDIYICGVHKLLTSFLFENENCGWCEVFDVAEECRNNVSVCGYSSLIYCCESCEPDGSLCAVYGFRVVSRGTIFLDASFKTISSNESLFKLSVASGLKSLCYMQTQLILIRNNSFESRLFPAVQCPCGLPDFNDLVSVAIEQGWDAKAAWGAALTEDGVLCLSDFKGTHHKVFGLGNCSTLSLHMCAAAGSILVASVSEGLLSVVKLSGNLISVVEPRCVYFRFPGSLIDAFFDDEELVIYKTADFLLYVAQLGFFWD